MEADQHRIHRRRAGHPLDHVVGESQQEHRCHRQQEEHSLGHQRGEGPVGGQIAHRPCERQHCDCQPTGEDPLLPAGPRNGRIAAVLQAPMADQDHSERPGHQRPGKQVGIECVGAGLGSHGQLRTRCALD
jgi:hypothetical protein